jgi:hypothetical protein
MKRFQNWDVGALDGILEFSLVCDARKNFRGNVIRNVGKPATEGTFYGAEIVSPNVLWTNLMSCKFRNLKFWNSF